MNAPLCKCGCGVEVAWDGKHARWRAYLPGHYRLDAPYKSAEWLHTQYVERNRTVADIAQSCGVSNFSVIRYMKRFGIKRRDGSESKVGRLVGPKNGSWKGGVTPERQRLYRSAEWKALLSEVFARDGYRCVRCRSGKRRKGYLHAHHVVPWADAPELRLCAENLVTLCKPCHHWVHSRDNVLRELLAA